MKSRLNKPRILANNLQRSSKSARSNPRTFNTALRACRQGSFTTTATTSTRVASHSARCYSTVPNPLSTEPTPLQLLPRPLGVDQPPSWTPLNYKEKHERFWDEKNIEKRTETLMKLNHEAYYVDVHKLNFHGGKRWIAPEQLIREERSRYFPDLAGKPLSNSPPPFTTESASERQRLMLERGPHVPSTKGKIHTAQIVRNNVSLIAITHSQISLEHVKAWTGGLLETWRGHERFRFIQVNLQQNTMRSLLVSLFQSNLKKQTGKWFHQSYMVSYSDVDYIRDAMGLENKYVGYVYLVDWAGRIRWAGCGQPWGGRESDVVPEGGKGGQVSEGLVDGLGEVQRLEVCTKVLMGRINKLAAEGKLV